MNRTDIRVFKIYKRRCTGGVAGLGIALFTAILFLILAGPLYAELNCSDCHGAGPHGAGCGSCGLSCHPNKLTNIKHPLGAGTPLSGDLSSADGIKAACNTCHIAPGSTHPFTINTDPSIVGAGTSLDYACGQCHGGSGASKPGIMYFDLNALSVYATGMHRGGNTAPTVANTNLVAEVSAGSAVSFTDNSTDQEDAQSTLSISVSWGDGSASSGSGGGFFSHIYSSAGSYNVLHTAKDPFGLYNSEAIPVKVMLNQTAQTKITVNVKTSTGAAISAARVYLRKAGVLKNTAYSNSLGVALFSRLVPAADYTIEVYKSGVNFGGGTGKTGPVPAAPANTTMGDAAVDINAITP